MQVEVLTLLMLKPGKSQPRQRKQDKLQDNKSGPKKNIIQPTQGPALEKPIGYGPGEKTGAGQLVFEG